MAKVEVHFQGKENPTLLWKEKKIDGAEKEIQGKKKGCTRRRSKKKRCISRAT